MLDYKFVIELGVSLLFIGYPEVTTFLNKPLESKHLIV